MLETRNSGNVNPNPNSAPLALKPRQVLLAEQHKKMAMTKAKKHNKALTLKPEQKALLLRSVLGYLERNGFSKSLKCFVSEAQIQDDNCKASSLDLEDMYCKYLESCSDADTNLNTYKEEELQTDGIARKDGASNCATSEENVSKKKKKKSDKSGNNVAAAADELTKSITKSEEVLANDGVTFSDVKPKEKKKSKKISDFLGQTAQCSEALEEPNDDIVCGLQMDKYTKKQKDKKKKSNLSSASPDVSVAQEQLDTKSLKEPIDDEVCKLQMDESKKKHKEKKEKKKTEVNAESLDGNVEQEQMESLPDVNEEKSNDLISLKRDSGAKVKTKDKNKKNNASSFVENVEQSGLVCNIEGVREKVVTDTALGNTGYIPLEEKKVESKDKKNKKERSTSEKLSDEVVEVLDKENPINGSGKEPFQISENVVKDKKDSKKRKRLVSEENKNQLVEEVAVGESKHRKTEGVEEANNTANGNLVKNGVEKSDQQKSIRKQRNGSAEPKTINAFQRVKADDVEFADERLQDNSYWAKDGAEVGYGAKAQEVLGQVRGRDFRHEKTKKKRGSYRGGQIDLQSRSVKFNYADDD